MAMQHIVPTDIKAIWILGLGVRVHVHVQAYTVILQYIHKKYNASIFLYVDRKYIHCRLFFFLYRRFKLNFKV
jgi:hypothetical protein